LTVLETSGVVVRFGGVVALDGLTFTVEPGQICGLIGPNGAGKTTLFNCVSRLYTPNEGRIRFDGEDLLARGPHEIARLGIARTFQNLAVVRSLSVRDNVMLGAHHRSRANFLTAALSLPGERREERDLRAQADEILERLELAHIADRPASGFPYGTLKRIELARTLCQRPRLLLLDEPASGLAHAEVEELRALLLSLRDDLGVTLLLVEHHMGMVMRISDKVVVLDFGRKIAEGPPDRVQRDERVVEAYLGGSGDSPPADLGTRGRMPRGGSPR
jgi:branched-chain amino acid transport system ATP-binding protein